MRLPKMKPAAHAGAAGDRAKARDNNVTIRSGRRPYQGKSGNARSPWQRAPTWTSPKGAAALDELQRLFSPPAQWVAAIRKENGGAIVVFSVFDCEADAESTCVRLRTFGLDARVRLIRDKTVAPGMTISHEPAR